MKQLQKVRIDEFKAHFQEDVLLPGDAGYDGVHQVLERHDQPQARAGWWRPYATTSRSTGPCARTCGFTYGS